MNNEGFGRKLFLWCNAIFLFVIMVVMFYPLLYVAFASFSDATALLRFNGALTHPLGFSLEAYKMVFKNHLILTGYRNTLIVVLGGTAINVALSTIAAYFFSRDGVMFQKPLMLIVLFTMFFGGGMIPTYLLVKGMGMIDTLWALMLPVAINTYNMIILKNGFLAVPKSLEESAMLDGAGHFTIMTRIVVPLSMNIIAVIILYYAVAHWNSWFQASIYIKKQTLYPLQLVLRQILVENDTASMSGDVGATDMLAVSETIKYAVIVVSTVPILCVYPFLQKYFVKGVMSGAVKG